MDADGTGKKQTAREASAFWVKFEQVTKILASLGVTAAAVITALQYIYANEGIRSERSLQFVQQWQTQELDKNFVEVQVFVEDRLKTVGSDLSKLEGPALKQALKNLGRAWLVENRNSAVPDDIEVHLDKLTLFFSQIEICVAADLCDASVVKSYFYSEVDSFWNYFSAYAELRRDAGYQEYGASVDGLVKRFADNDVSWIGRFWARITGSEK